MSDVSLAATLQGEGGVCGLNAMLILAWMVTRGRGPFYGVQEPGLNASYVARWYYVLGDPLPWAKHAFSDQDMQLARVRAIVRNMRCVRVPCKNGLAINFCGEE